MLKLFKEIMKELTPYCLKLYVALFVLIFVVMSLVSSCTHLDQCDEKMVRIEVVFPVRPAYCGVASYLSPKLKSLGGWLTSPIN